MDTEKKHILNSYKNEQEEIEEIERIKKDEEKEVDHSPSNNDAEMNGKNDNDSSQKPANSSISGYNVKKKTENDLATNPFSPGKLDIGELAFKDHDDISDNPDALDNKSNDLDRPIPEREINNRVR